MATKMKTIDWGGLKLSLKDIEVNVAGPNKVGTGTEVLGSRLATTLRGRRSIIADGATVALDANDSGGLVVLDKSDGTVITLPAAAAGLWYEFVITATPASVGHKVICTSGDFIVGSVLLDDGDTGLTTTAQAFNGTTHLAINIDAATDGWLAGGRFTLTAISDTQWVIEGHLLHTGNVASPAATS